MLTDDTAEAPRTRSSHEPQAPPAALVVMGASGDLTARKLIPAIDELHAGGLLPDGFALVGYGAHPDDRR